MNQIKIRRFILAFLLLTIGMMVRNHKPMREESSPTPVDFAGPQMSLVATPKNSAPLRTTQSVVVAQSLTGVAKKQALRWREEPSQPVGDLIRRRWVLRWQGVPVFPLRERVETYSRQSGELLSRSGELGDSAVRAPEGDFVLSERDALRRAAHYRESSDSGLARRTQTVEKILWNEDRLAGADSRWAYRVWDQGREVIVDGITGIVLQCADRRVLN